MARGFLEVDDSEVIRMSARFPIILDAEMRRLLPVADDLAKATLVRVFLQFANQKGFYTIYADHVLEVLSSANIPIARTDAGFILTFTWSMLGTPEDLRRGFHQGAALKGKGKHHPVGSPWTGSESSLRNPQITRHKAWKAIASGIPWEKTRVNKKGQTSHYSWPGDDVDLGELFEETKEARVAIWGSRAPEWILLDQGTPWYPPIMATSFADESYFQVGLALQDLFYDAVNYAQYRTDELSRTGKVRKIQGQTSTEFSREAAYLRNRRSTGQFAVGYRG